MPELNEHIQRADWKTEKHVPVIESPDQVRADEVFEVRVSLGKHVAHPNTTEHHIRWIDVYFLPEGSKFTHQVAHVEFSAHGESTTGPNTGPVYTQHEAGISLRVNTAGTLFALALCNIHGLWESSKGVRLG
jgi:superoxide reductase